jgi:hypothetical protein
MNDTRRLRGRQPQDPVTAFLAALDGARIPGGCDHCDAYQAVQAHAGGTRVHLIRVYHDDDCPWWLARKRAAQ